MCAIISFTCGLPMAPRATWISTELEGEVFEPLKEFFSILLSRLTLSTDLHTVTWLTVRILRLSSCTQKVQNVA